jgi:ABC-type phosphate/phosphonate transport system substrate-binding protein
MFNDEFFLTLGIPVIASLPMYDFAEVRQATDGLWAAIASAYGTDTELSRVGDWTAPWRDPNLLFSQTCGYPFTHEFADVLAYVATPCYAADGCDGPLYRSILFARTAGPLESFRGTKAAFNNRDSMSGMLALQLVFTPFAQDGKFFASALETGGHMASLYAVKTGLADICAIDCVTVAYVRRYCPDALVGLVEIGRSPRVPGLPFVTRAGDPQRLRAALTQALQNPDTRIYRDRLLIVSTENMPPRSYDVIPALEKHMTDRGGVTLW